MKKFMLVAALFVVLIPSIASAQEVVTQNVPAPAVKPLTAEEKATLENKVIKMELLARELSPEALGKAIADLIAEKQQAYQAATQDLNTYTTSIQIEGTVLNRDPKTGEFSRVKK